MRRQKLKKKRVRVRRRRRRNGVLQRTAGVPVRDPPPPDRVGVANYPIKEVGVARQSPHRVTVDEAKRDRTLWETK